MSRCRCPPPNSPYQLVGRAWHANGREHQQMIIKSTQNESAQMSAPELTLPACWPRMAGKWSGTSANDRQVDTKCSRCRCPPPNSPYQLVDRAWHANGREHQQMIGKSTQNESAQMPVPELTLPACWPRTACEWSGTSANDRQIDKK